MATTPLPPRYKTCLNCQKEFCDIRARADGTPFRVKGIGWSKLKYCSRKCIPQAINQKKVCEVCSKDIWKIKEDKQPSGQPKTIDNAKWAKTRWCSKACRWKSQGAYREIKQCVICGKSYDNSVIKLGKKTYVNSAKFSKQQTCSNKCSTTKKMARTSKQAFYDNVTPRGLNECWPWEGLKMHAGHGRIELKALGNKGVLAHRLSYAIHHGRLPGRRWVCHDCGNPCCVNPHHLYAGDPLTNARDRFGRPRPEAKDFETGVKDLVLLENGDVAYVDE